MRMLLLLLGLLAMPALSATAFVAVPDRINGEMITDAGERMAQQVKIAQSGGQFRWASNSDVVLTRIFSGNKIIFLASGGEGMIIVLNQSNLPEHMREGDGRPFLYCEHRRRALGFESYCGGSQEVAVSQ